MRQAARERLLEAGKGRIDEIERFAEAEKDPEARAAALEVAASLDFAATSKDQMLFLYACEDFPAVELSGPPVLRSYLRLAAHAEPLAELLGPWDRVVRIPASFRNGDPTEGIAMLAFEGLRALTFETLPDDVGAWRAYVRSASGRTWRELRREGLQKRGFDVMSRDANRAAAEFLRAQDGAAEWGDPSFSRSMRDIFHGALNAVLDDAFRRPAVFLGAGETGKATGPLCVPWALLNRGHFRWQGDVLVSTAQPEDFAARLDDPDPAIRIAALRVLSMTPEAIPAAAWRVVADDPEFALPILYATPLRVPAGAIGDVLASIHSPLLRADLRHSWDPDVLRDFVLDPDTEPAIRARALEAMLASDVRSLPAMDPSAAGGDLSRSAAERGDGGEALAAFLDACVGDEQRLARVAAWWEKTWATARSNELAFALLVRGRREGLKWFATEGDSFLLSPLYYDLVRPLVDGAPVSDRPSAWHEWGAAGVESLEWDPLLQKWTTPD